MNVNSQPDTPSQYVTDTSQTSGTDSAVTAIIEAVSRKSNKDPLECDPLYKQINAEALNCLMSSGVEAISVEFEYEGYRIQVEKESTNLTVELSDSS